MLNILLPHTPISAKHIHEGVVMLIDKPLGWTSFDVVNKLRYVLKKHFDAKKLKVGHAGTLDPLATGLLIICVGPYTRRIQTFQDEDKTYIGTIAWGAETPSYDLETPPQGSFPTDHLTETYLEQVKLNFVGEISQVPPMYSALKVDGERLYAIARREGNGEPPPEVKSRKITVNRFDLSNFRTNLRPDEQHPPKLERQSERLNIYPPHEGGVYADFEVVCTKGTYIRSLAYDMGKSADSGAYLSRLRRTGSGGFDIADAWSLEELVAQLETENR